MKINLRNGSLLVIGSCAALLAAQMTAMAGGTVTHRYSFFNMPDGTAITDSVGTANGTNFGTAVVSSGQLDLDGGGGDYVQLPTGIITNDLAVTVEAWATYPPIGTGGQGTWANLFDFGAHGVVDGYRSDAYSISFCVNSSGTGQCIAGISDFDDANVNRQNCATDGNPMADLAYVPGTYVAVVFNPPAGYSAIYVNGTLMAKLLGVTNTITPGVRDVSNLIGWDNWPDATMEGFIQEFRIWNGALNPLEIAASYQNGSNNIITNAGSITGIQLQPLTAMVFGGLQQAAVVGQASLITNTVDVTSFCTYTSGNIHTVTVDTNGVIRAIGVGTTTITASNGVLSSVQSVTVNAPALVMTHRYGFTNDATDSVGTNNGTLMGTAAISGGQLVLDGSTGCYLDLSTNGGIITGYPSATIDYWATFTTLQNWSYVWAFGSSPHGAGVNYIHNVPRDAAPQHRIDHNSGVGGAAFNMAGDFQNETVHCTTVVDPNTGELAVFTNGILSGYSTADHGALTGIATNLVYIGRSLWTSAGPFGTGDPYMLGSIDEFRVYSGTMTPVQVAMADLSGPNNTNINPGALQSIAIALPSSMEMGTAIKGGLIGNYANLPNYNIGLSTLTNLPFASSDSNIVAQAANGLIRAYNVGSATITATYQGLQSSQLVTVTRPPIPVLVHEYRFHDAPASTTAADSIGGAAFAGTLPNGGTFTGTQLMLEASNNPSGDGVTFLPQYVQLPVGILASNGTGTSYPAVTIQFWASYTNTNGAGGTSLAIPVNAQVFAFGNTDAGGAGEYYLFAAPQGGRMAISDADPGYNDEQGSGGAGNWSGESNFQVTIVFNCPAHYDSLYTNGVFVSADTAVTINLSSVTTNDVLNYLNHSLYTGDPYYSMTFSEFRIYNGSLLPDEIAATQVLGPGVVLTPAAAVNAGTSISGGNAVLSWPLTSAGLHVESSPTLTGAVWTPYDATPTIVGQQFQVSIAPVGAAKYFRLKR
jgi:hypothetical protein